MVALQLSVNDNGEYTLKFTINLKDKPTSELDQELAYACFDLLFVQTQLEANRTRDPSRRGERRLAKMHEKITALKDELFGRDDYT